MNKLKISTRLLQYVLNKIKKLDSTTDLVHLTRTFIFSNHIPREFVVKSSKSMQEVN